MKTENILKIADIDSASLCRVFVKFITEEIHPSYKDEELKEHIYNIDTVLENQQEGEDNGFPCPPMYMKQLIEIKELCDTNECGYFRIIF